MAGIGFDCGTYNLISSTRDESGEIKCKREVNAFLQMPLENRFMFNMMKTAGVRMIEDQSVAYAVGEAAVDIAYTLNQVDLRRPMKDGCVNPKEKDAFKILSIMIHSLIGEVEHDGTPLCYSVPANAINEETDADYHQQVLKLIFDKYEVNKKRLSPMPINEALALIYAECGDKNLTGIGISFGAGMVNVCFANLGFQAFAFSIVNSGDWIDKQVARVTSETTTFINKEKTKVDLKAPPKNSVERAIQMQYRIMIEKTMRGIKDGISQAGSKARAERPVDIILAGGTASPNGFDDIVKEVVGEIEFPIEIGEIKRPKDHLYAVSRGCLIAAEQAV